MTGAWRVARLHLRTGWVSLLAWPLVMALVVIAVGSSITALYPDAASREAYAVSLQLTSISATFNGRGYDLGTAGGIVSNEVGFIGQISIPAISLILAVGRTRKQEDAGRADLLTASPIGRLATLAGAALVLGCALAIFGIVAWAGLVAVGLPAAGSAHYALGLTLMALAAAGVGLLLGEVAQDARTATGAGIAGIFGAYLLRSTIDGNDWPATWASPLGWIAELRPWGSDGQWWPLAAYGALIVVSVLAAAWVAVRRDLGSGILPVRPGPAHGGRWLGTSAGHALRFTRGAFLGWTIGLVVWGAAIGMIAESMAEVVAASPTLLDLFGVERADQLILLLVMVINALGALALGLQGIGVMAAEEESGRLGLALSAPVRRARHWGWWLAVVAAEVTVALLAGNVAAGVATEISSGQAGAVRDSLGASGPHLAAVLAVVALAAFLRAAVPRWWGAAWAALAWATVVALLGDALDLPNWARDLSPLEAVGRIPVEPASGGVVAGLVAAGIVLAVASVAVFARRDLRRG